MVRFALAGVSGMTRSAIAPLVVPPPGGGDGAAGDCAGAGVTAGAADRSTGGDAGADGRDRMKRNAIRASSMTAPAAMAATRRLSGGVWLMATGRAPISAGAI